MPASVPSPYQALHRFNYSPLLLLSGSLARVTHRRASLFLIKLLWNVGKADAEEVGVKRSLYRRSKILHCSVYSALWLGGLRCQCRRQTNGPLAARCPCVMVLGKKTKKLFCRPLQCVGPPGKCPITNPALHDTIHITIQRPRYDTYHDTGLHWISPQNNLVKQLFIKHCIL